MLDAGMICDYDLALHRLKCYHDDVYHGITPNANAADYNPEPPVFASRFCTTPGYEEILALANEDGKVAFQNTRIKDEQNLPLEGSQVAIYLNCHLTSELLISCRSINRKCIYSLRHTVMQSSILLGCLGR